MSVRKAFLELDQDRDGLIDAEDIARYFGEEEPIDLMDLRALMTEKKRMREKTMKEVGAIKTGLGDQKPNDHRMKCSDFTYWVGESIHQRENFYFRHDSMKNPVQEAHVKRRANIDKINQEMKEKMI